MADTPLTDVYATLEPAVPLGGLRVGTPLTLRYPVFGREDLTWGAGVRASVAF